MSVVNQMITNLQEMNSNFHHRFANLTEEDKTSLYSFMSIFDKSESGDLNKRELRAAADLLKFVRHVDQSSLRNLSDILHLLDFHQNGLVDPDEEKVAIEILKVFTGAEEGDDSTLNHDEFSEAFKAVKFFDKENNGVLSKEERRSLKDALKNKDYFQSLGK